MTREASAAQHLGSLRAGKFVVRFQASLGVLFDEFGPLEESLLVVQREYILAPAIVAILNSVYH
jgi:hypothetical protein